MAFDPKRVEVHVHDAHNVVASYANVLVQVRVGAMDITTLNRIESVARLLRTRHKGPVGAIGIVEESADLTDPATRARQREVMKSLLSDPRTYSAGVMPGDSVKAGLIRSFVRMILIGQPRFHVAHDLTDACVWLSERLETHSPDELLSFAEHVRKLAHAGR
jgi:hypothetical protein